MTFSYKQEILRKSVHLSSLWMVACICFLPKPFLLVLFGALFVLNVSAEYGYYRKQPFCRALYGRVLDRMLRDKATDGTFRLSGSPYVLAAAFIVTLLFVKEAAAAALAVMLVGDTAAALVGRKFGRHKLNEGKKSVEGSAAFLISSLLVLYVFAKLCDFPTLVCLAGAGGVFMAMLAEIYEDKLHVDDNFSIPLCVGFALSAVL